MPKLMFITPRISDPPVGGRAMLSQLHLNCLRSLLGERLFVHSLDPAPAPGISGVARALGGRIDGVTAKSEAAILAGIRELGIGRVYLNGSNLGRLAEVIKTAMPEIKVITFCHNVEARFFVGALKARPGPRALGVLAANQAAERAAVRWSDRLLALSRRDSEELHRRYGRRATDIVPMALEDQLDSHTPPDPRVPKGDYVLFVGGAFYANEAGIRWFAERVAPKIAIRTCIVGRGLEVARAALEQSPNVRVVGTVERLGGWYLGAKAAIAPIFDGSGMKTKVAEALMFGKRIVGTSEAFSGYEEVAGAAGWQCADEAQFVAAMNEVAAAELPRFDRQLRSLYERHYSTRALLVGLSEVLGAELPEPVPA
jgi:glycosyltransferase involved in cell wall biosynthesis